ncbi:hypothetical protein BATDEDRAFT_86626 [Batrachochytrium dendrobatidis JAM81]|uniref:Uncharacterized protein n=1 Tax=Batrachochytrium dendrobatidis (strain JAM81 / FGSC 10211) TaxID=684364 RepID=F4NW31_BATDJ|nr:uncharacterized protein BATDEDRAFT_86626 [Batrachochytrium dendrobatidis JAM81]EGF82408.1 hypothetical protein BATDEDRAFT_86626 [Batrachochytrium dendrobatidis JAM81]|eukprot:XP_006676915.1 hypothetical protein BATDEDRAFT_86626 [Batrachochytrium dendrobatidis JAM81]
MSEAKARSKPSSAMATTALVKSTKVSQPRSSNRLGSSASPNKLVYAYKHQASPIISLQTPKESKESFEMHATHSDMNITDSQSTKPHFEQIDLSDTNGVASNTQQAPSIKGSARLEENASILPSSHPNINAHPPVSTSLSVDQTQSHSYLQLSSTLEKRSVTRPTSASVQKQKGYSLLQRPDGISSGAIPLASMNSLNMGKQTLGSSVSKQASNSIQQQTSSQSSRQQKLSQVPANKSVLKTGNASVSANSIATKSSRPVSAIHSDTSTASAWSKRYTTAGPEISITQPILEYASEQPAETNIGILQDSTQRPKTSPATFGMGTLIEGEADQFNDGSMSTPVLGEAGTLKSRPSSSASTQGQSTAMSKKPLVTRPTSSRSRQPNAEQSAQDDLVKSLRDQISQHQHDKRELTSTNQSLMDKTTVLEKRVKVLEQHEQHLIKEKELALRDLENHRRAGAGERTSVDTLRAQIAEERAQNASLIVHNRSLKTQIYELETVIETLMQTAPPDAARQAAAALKGIS